MVRVDDNGGITERISAGALGMTMSRAAEGLSDRPLFIDPYAPRLVEAAAAEHGWRWPDTDDTIDRIADIDPDLATWLRTMTQYGLCRTKYFDDFFMAAGAVGIGQMVILATGLDTRAWRLEWAEDTVVFDIDQPKVSQFKAEILGPPDATVGARYVAIPVDLHLDWTTALLENGFDTSEPTAWSVEGRLHHLPAAQQVLLLDRIQMLSAANSWIAADVFTSEFNDQENVRRLREHRDRIDAIFERSDAATGFADLLDDEQVRLVGERTDVASWLPEHGWATTSTRAVDTMARYGRHLPADVDTALVGRDFLDANLGGGDTRSVLPRA